MGTLEIGPYAERPFGVHAADPRAHEVAAAVAELVASAVPGARVEHVGSTAVPGLPGSGVVDLVLVASPGSVDRAADRLARRGFQRRDARGDRPAGPLPPAARSPETRSPEARPATAPVLVGSVAWRSRPYAVRMAVLPDGDPALRDAIELRDMLLADPLLRRDYAAEKRRIASLSGADQPAYDDGKAAWVVGALARRRSPDRSEARIPGPPGSPRVSSRSIVTPDLGRASAAEPEAGPPPESREPILPPATIGILGGGQLGRMIAMAARAMGYRIAVLDPDRACPAAPVADDLVQGRYDDPEAAVELARGCDVVTYELEHVDASLIEAVLASGVPVRPGLLALRVSQDRLAERRWVEAQGARVARWREVRSAAEVRVALRDLGLPVRLKAPLGGYDGRSQVRIAREVDIAAAWEALAGPPSSRDPRLPRASRPALLLEEELAFTEEVSVVVARGPGGDPLAFPVARNVHDAGILVESVAPAPVAPATVALARHLGERLATALGVVGTLTVEMFVLADGSLVVNELAPRVHNSGHWTIEGCRTSQFAQHVRAICGLPLGSIEMTGCAATVNLLGAGPERQALLRGLDRALADPDVAVHLYDKRRVFTRRKMGHVTAVAGSPEEALDRARAALAHLSWEA